MESKKQWEYDLMPISTPNAPLETFKTVLNYFGEDGWELVTTSEIEVLEGNIKCAIFKRPKE